MNKYSTEKLYAIPPLVVEAGLKKCKGRLNYFTALDNFLAVSPARIEHLDFSIKSKKLKTYAAELKEFDNLLDTISAIKLHFSVTAILAALKKGDFEKILSLHLALMKKVVEMNEAIVLAQTLVDEVEHDYVDVFGEVRRSTKKKKNSDVEVKKTKKLLEKLEILETRNIGKMQAPISWELFANLKALLENLELYAAQKEILEINRFTYNRPIDEKLYDIELLLEDFDLEGAYAELDSLREMAAHYEEIHAKHEERIKLQAAKDMASKELVSLNGMEHQQSEIKRALMVSYNVHTFKNYLAASDYLRSERSGLLIIDEDNCKMSVAAFLDIIRKLDYYEDTPILFLVRAISIDLRQIQENDGNCEFYKKPIDRFRLLEKVNSMVK